MKIFYLKISSFLLLAVYLLSRQFDAYTFFSLLFVLLITLLSCLITSKTIYYLLSVIYLALSWFHPILACGYFLLPTTIEPIYSLLILLPFAYFLLPPIQAVMVIVSSVLMYTMIALINHNKCLTNELQQTKDLLISTNRHAKSKQEHLLQMNEHELQLSVLNERNRIARDIHDNVGHLITRALLQVGVLQVKQPSPEVDDIKDTLDKAMNAIRVSVHALYHDSIKLQAEIETLISDLPNQLTIDFQYQLTNEPSEVIRRTLLLIIKEAINNTLKHSNATNMKIHLDESPNHYYCLLHDNGNSPDDSNLSSGIGLQSITHRIQQINGIINVQKQAGFRIYVSIPKEVK